MQAPRFTPCPESVEFSIGYHTYSLNNKNVVQRARLALFNDVNVTKMYGGLLILYKTNLQLSCPWLSSSPWVAWERPACAGPAWSCMAHTALVGHSCFFSPPRPWRRGRGLLLCVSSCKYSSPAERLSQCNFSLCYDDTGPDRFIVIRCSDPDRHVSWVV